MLHSYFQQFLFPFRWDIVVTVLSDIEISHADITNSLCYYKLLAAELKDAIEHGISQCKYEIIKLMIAEDSLLTDQQEGLCTIKHLVRVIFTDIELFSMMYIFSCTVCDWNRVWSTA